MAGTYLARLLDATAVKTLVEDLALVAEVTRAGLVGLGRLGVVSAASTLAKLNLGLLESLKKNKSVRI